MPAMLARRLVPVMAGHANMLAPRLNEGRYREASRWCGSGAVSGQPAQRALCCMWPVGSLAGAAQRKRDTARGVRASMDCPTTTEPGVGCPAPSLLKTDTRGTRSSGRNGACAIRGPARASSRHDAPGTQSRAHPPGQSVMPPAAAPKSLLSHRYLAMAATVTAAGATSACLRCGGSGCQPSTDSITKKPIT